MLLCVSENGPSMRNLHAHRDLGMISSDGACGHASIKAHFSLEEAMTAASGNPVRATAHAILRALSQSPHDEATLRAEVRSAAETLAKVPDLASLGVKREANHAIASYYLYYDTEMKITLDYLSMEKKIPPHEHGAWEAFVVYSGSLQHTVYRQIDDNETAGYAELEVVEDRRLKRGDFSLVAPPADIHGFTAYDDGTCVLTVATGHYLPNRRYFDPAKRTSAVQATKNTR